MVKCMEALHTKPDDAVGSHGVAVRDEPDTTRVVVLQRVIKRVPVHVTRLVLRAQKVSVVKPFTKSKGFWRPPERYFSPQDARTTYV